MSLMRTWLEIAWMIGALVLVLLVAAPTLWRKAVARRGIWLLDSRPKPHVCHLPSRPRRRTLGWRCSGCGRVYRARQICGPGDPIWHWDEVDEETGTTAPERARAEVAERREQQRPGIESARSDLYRYWAGPDCGQIGFVIKRFVQGALDETQAVGYLLKLLETTDHPVDRSVIRAAIEGVHRLEAARVTAVRTAPMVYQPRRTK